MNWSKNLGGGSIFTLILKPPHEDLFFTNETDWIFRHDSSGESCGGGESQVPC
jgi:hypothetical protein